MPTICSMRPASAQCYPAEPFVQNTQYHLLQAEKGRRTQLAALRQQAAEAAAASANRTSRLEAARCCKGFKTSHSGHCGLEH
jgi:hypothetical protein